MMRQAKILLPALNVLLASTMLFLGDKQLRFHPWAGAYPLDLAPAQALCYALNGPALLFRFFALWTLEQLHLGSSQHQVMLDNALFLVGVSLLWYLVGLRLQVERRDPSLHFRSYVLFEIVLLGMGISMLSFGVGSWHFTHVSSPARALVQATLFGLWGISLIWACMHDLRRPIQ